MTKTLDPLALSKVPAKSVFKIEPAPKVDHLPLMHLGDIPRSDTLMFTFAKAVSMRRDHGSITDAEFAAWLAHDVNATMIDSLGNIHVDLRSDKSHRTLFTSHIDSVHDGGGHNRVRIDGKFWRADGAALGADDGAGVALLAHLIRNEVPGYYIFFRGEECGGIGSSGLYEHDSTFFQAFDRAIAFDRAGYSDVITHQGGTRCCSDKFAHALSAALTPDDFSLAFVPNDGGVYTDTAEFVDTIPECTNVSVGYFSQHSDREYQDIDFLQKLAVQLLRVQWDELPTDRDPRVYEDRWERYARYGSNTLPPTVPKDVYDHFDDPELTELAKTAINACEMWLIGTNRRMLIDLIAEWASPEDPSAALRLMKPERLTERDVQDALTSLDFGWSAELILADLFETCEVI